MSTTQISGTGITTPELFGNPIIHYPIGRNVVVNGSCAIDQLYSGALHSPVVAFEYPIDNVLYYGVDAGKFSTRQIASTTSILGSLGATNFLQYTVLNATALTASSYFCNRSLVEGLNMARFRWGTSNALPASLQFKVNSSVTGTFSGCINSQDGGRSYTFTYTVPVANTDYLIKIENIPGDSGGSQTNWPVGNVLSCIINFDLGSGASNTARSATTNQAAGGANLAAWQAGNYIGVKSTVSVAATNGATFNITDVQLEQSTYCTQFERKLYDQDLRECQRYFYIRNASQANDVLFLAQAYAADKVWGIVYNSLFR